jgi:hypothetical protein
LELETIREIISFSHDGFGHMWYPFAATLENNNTTISAEYYCEVQDMLNLISSMFATNNHNPELVSKRNAKMSRRHLLGEDKKTQCSVRFRTDVHEYILQRCFIGEYSIESKLQIIGSSIVYYGHNVIQMLSKFNKPIIIDEGEMYTNKSLIFKPLDDYSRSCLVALSNNWARMIGIMDSGIGVDYDGRWSTNGKSDAFGEFRSSRRARFPSPLRLLTNLAQAVVKKRTFGICVPIFSPFDVGMLGEFETITIMDLMKNICREEGLQFIVGVNTSSSTNSMINAIETPRLSVYQL